MKLHIYMILAMFGLLFLPSCEVSDNGDLDGTWYMTRMDSIVCNQSQEMRSQRKTWSFENHLMQVFNHMGTQQYERSHTIMSHFSVEGDQLIILDPFVYDRMHGDIFFQADSLDRLRAYGINQIPDTFVIEKLNRSKLQISNQLIRICFDKY